MKILTQPVDNGIDKVSKKLGAIMDELLGQSLFRPRSGDWEPQINIYETSDRYLVCANLAGMQHNEIDLHEEGGKLHIRGERPKPVHAGCAETPSVHVMEIDWGRFHRSISIPDDADASAITASYRNGYLWVQLPKRSPGHQD